jgi:hypothetical protein
LYRTRYKNIRQFCFPFFLLHIVFYKSIYTHAHYMYNMPIACVIVYVFVEVKNTTSVLIRSHIPISPRTLHVTYSCDVFEWLLQLVSRLNVFFYLLYSRREKYNNVHELILLRKRSDDHLCSQYNRCTRYEQNNISWWSSSCATQAVQIAFLLFITRLN